MRTQPYADWAKTYKKYQPEVPSLWLGGDPGPSVLDRFFPLRAPRGSMGGEGRGAVPFCGEAEVNAGR
jgi:hypothetical protein